MDRARLLRPAMKQMIHDMVEMSTTDQVEGKVYIVYERVGDLQWLPGKGDGESFRQIKHWRLVVQLGFDCFTLEFLENSLVSQQGIVMVGAFDAGDFHQKGTTRYPLGDLSEMSSYVMFKWIQDEFSKWTTYNLRKRNCQHFVRHFLAFVEESGYLINPTYQFGAVMKRSVRNGGVGKKRMQSQESLSPVERAARLFGLSTKSRSLVLSSPNCGYI
ncbi:hypothetical protein BG015_010790 [Linnemannia schmuckeri]|uniref:Uncharacterized protein n=1 Tax=Linnemannia schmuckeri TaxID=64567 RepID=A0A9P5RTZ7_9FUNG|nr:hypothetical protein BG015_010790 [Linnemannia schmuckeri]